MALNPFFSDTGVKAAVDALAALCNSGTLLVYSGSQPADANTAVSSQVLLASMTFSATAFASSAASGPAGSRVVTATANAIGSGTAAATGTAAWFRCLKSDGSTAVLDGSAGASGCDLNFSSAAFTAGAAVSVSSFTISQSE